MCHFDLESLLRRLLLHLEGATTNHIGLYLGRDFLVCGVKVFHGLILCLFRTLLNLLHLRSVLWVRLGDRLDLSRLLIVNALHRPHNVSCRHESINRLTLRQ